MVDYLQFNKKELKEYLFQAIFIKLVSFYCK